MKEVYARTLTIVIRWWIIALAFLLPIFFLSFTNEFYNFNKYVLLVGSAAILTVLWATKMVLESRVRIIRTPADLPILIFLAASLLATIFSVDPYISLLGWYPRWHFSFVSVLSYSLLYFITVSSLDGRHRRYLIWAAVAAGLVLGFITTAAYFGQNLFPASYTHARNWTPIGSINHLVFYILICLPLALSLVVKEKNNFLKAVAGVAVFFMAIAFAAANIPIAWVVLGISVAIFLAFSPKIAIDKSDRYLLATLAVVFVVVALIFTTGSLKDSIVKPLVKGKPATLDLGREASLPLASAWKVTARGVGDRPLLGSGPGTYLFDYAAGKPVEINKSKDWNTRFDLPSNDYLNVLSTFGIIGILAYLLLLISIFKTPLTYIARSAAGKQAPEIVFLVSSLVSFIVGTLFFDSAVTSFFLFIVASTTAFSYLRDAGVAGIDDVDLRLVALRAGGIVQVEPTGRPKQNNLGLFLLVPALVVLAAVLYIGWNVYAGEIYMRRASVAANANKGKDTRDNLLAATRANPYSDVYHRTLMLTDLSIARSLNQKGNLSQNEQSTLVGLIAEAINEGKIVTGYDARGLGVFNIKKVPGTSAGNVSNWESLALVYSNIGGQQKADATIHAKNAYSRAIQLDPLNPTLYEALGNIYLNENDFDNAIKLFESAVQAKSDYASAHYNLAQALQAKGGNDNLTKAVNELSQTLQLLPQKGASHDQVQKQYDELRKKLDAQNSTKQPPATSNQR